MEAGTVTALRLPSQLALVIICFFLPVFTGTSWSQHDTADLRVVIEEQRKQLEELQKRIDAQFVARQQEEVRNAAPVAVEANAVKKIVADYLHENPGAGMPPSVQTGYSTTTGFVIRSAPNPSYVNWDDDCKIPFELRVRGRLQLAYYNYKVTDRTNHLFNVPATQNINSVRLADFSQI